MCSKYPILMSVYDQSTGDFTGLMVNAIIVAPFTNIKKDSVVLATSMVGNKLVLTIHFSEDSASPKYGLPTPIVHSQFIPKATFDATGYVPRTDGITINATFGPDNFWVYSEECWFNYLSGQVICTYTRYWINSPLWPA